MTMVFEMHMSPGSVFEIWISARRLILGFAPHVDSECDNCNWDSVEVPAGDLDLEWTYPIRSKTSHQWAANLALAFLSEPIRMTAVKLRVGNGESKQTTVREAGKVLSEIAANGFPAEEMGQVNG